MATEYHQVARDHHLLSYRPNYLVTATVIQSTKPVMAKLIDFGHFCYHQMIADCNTQTYDIAIRNVGPEPIYFLRNRKGEVSASSFILIFTSLRRTHDVNV